MVYDKLETYINRMVYDKLETYINRMVYDKLETLSLIEYLVFLSLI